MDSLVHMRGIYTLLSGLKLTVLSEIFLVSIVRSDVDCFERSDIDSTWRDLVLTLL